MIIIVTIMVFVTSMHSESASIEYIYYPCQQLYICLYASHHSSFFIGTDCVYNRNKISSILQRRNTYNYNYYMEAASDT